MRIGLAGSAPVSQRYRIGGQTIEVFDLAGSLAAGYVAGELVVDTYGLRRMQFNPGDYVVDIGGHIGLFAIYLGLLHPGLRICSYEPHPANFWLFDRNLAINGVKNVRLYPEAVTGDGRNISLSGNSSNSGANSAWSSTLSHGCVSGLPSVTLDQVFERDGIRQCKLLKIDCEGSEYEILNGATNWARIEHLCGEFHSNRLLESRGFSPEVLQANCEREIGASRVRVSSCRMSE